MLDPDEQEGEARVIHRVAELMPSTRLLVALGGDNSITHSVSLGAWGDRVGEAGLITLDAHHDLRDGSSNGSPVRRLIEAGLAGDQGRPDRHRRLLQLPRVRRPGP